jgi:thioredoxin-related protein
VPVLLFVIATSATFLLIQRWRRNEAKVAAPNIGSTEKTPGLAEGDLVNLPRLPSLHSDYVELNSVKEKYLLCVFISTACASCAQDHEFWKDLKTEAGDDVAFYVVSIDGERSTVEKYVKAYEFEDLSVLFDPQRQALVRFNIRFVPQYVLLTQSGKVLARWNGLRRYDPKQTKAIDKLEGFRERISNPSLVH